MKPWEWPGVEDFGMPKVGLDHGSLVGSQGPSGEFREVFGDRHHRQDQVGYRPGRLGHGEVDLGVPLAGEEKVHPAGQLARTENFEEAQKRLPGIHLVPQIPFRPVIQVDRNDPGTLGQGSGGDPGFYQPVGEGPIQALPGPQA